MESSKRSSLTVVLLVLCLLRPGLTAPAKAAPAIDKQFVAEYLRYAEAFTPQVQISVDDPKPSGFPGFYELLVHLRMNRNEAIRSYYISEDGKQIVSGKIFDIHRSPFADALSKLSPDGAPSFGNANAPVTIYVFSDFECPYCREEATAIRKGIEKDQLANVRVLFKNFPLEAIHPWARPAALSGICIADQKPAAFWTFHDWAYEHQREINVQNVLAKSAEFAKTQGLNEQKLKGCVAAPGTAKRLDEQINQGRRLGVMQTPTLFVNGRMMGGVLEAGQLNSLIKLELDRTEKSPKQSAAEACCSVDIPALAKK